MKIFNLLPDNDDRQIAEILAKRLFAALPTPCVKSYVIRPGSVDVIIRCEKTHSWQCIKIFAGSESGFICHPRTGKYATMPIYTLGGDIIPVRGVFGGGWYPIDEAGTSIDVIGPRNDNHTINNPDGSVLTDNSGVVLEF